MIEITGLNHRILNNISPQARTKVSRAQIYKTMTEHTAGNWYAHDGQIYPIETGKTLALIPYFDENNEEQAANAKLIAAAPVLLDALKRAYSIMATDKKNNGTEIMEIMREAIQKTL